MKTAIAPVQDELSAADLAQLLALVRGGTLAGAAERVGVDASTVFRSLQRIEKRLGQRLFERGRQGYLPTDAMLALATHAERIETELEAARGALRGASQEVVGRVRLTTVDAVLRGLVLPVLPALAQAHPGLQLDLRAGNEMASLTRRDADLALRALGGAAKPPDHLVGRMLGTIRFVLCAPRAWPARRRRAALEGLDWIAPDDALPEHPSVRWRRRHLPKVVPRHGVDGIVGVLDAVRSGLGVGIVPLFLQRMEPQLVPLAPPLDDCTSTLWLLAHPESRHLRRIAAVFQHFAEHVPPVLSAQAQPH